MNETKKHISLAMDLLDRQVRRVGNDLERNSENLKNLVANRDQDSQAQISSLSEGLSNLQADLIKIRDHLVEGSASIIAQPDDSPESTISAESENSESTDRQTNSSQGYDVDLSAQEAADLRHDEEISISGVVRSLLMANEPAQRERRNQAEV